MKRVPPTVKSPGRAIAACVLLLSWAAVATAGARSGSYIEVKLTAEDGEENDGFGASVAISGTTALIGATGDDTFSTNWAYLTGSVYVYERDPGDPALWVQGGKLTPGAGRYPGDRFGDSVAIRGDTAVVGAPGDDKLPLDDSGAAYVYERDPLDPAGWTQTARLSDSPSTDPSGFHGFGDSVAIAGDTLVIGAYLDDAGGDGDHGGAAYVYERDPADRKAWTRTAKLVAADPVDHQAFGFAIATSGDIVIVGAKYDHDLAPYAGAAYLFERDPGDRTTWIQTAKLTASDGEEHDQFGRSVAIAGDSIIVGAWQQDLDGDGIGGAGSAYVFERNPFDPSGWTETAKLTAVDGVSGDLFGASVAISGDRAVIGAPLHDDGGEEAGAAYVFRRDRLDPREWEQIDKLIAGGGGPHDTLAASVAASGPSLLLSATGDDEKGFRAGAAYVYLVGEDLAPAGQRGFPAH